MLLLFDRVFDFGRVDVLDEPCLLLWCVVVVVADDLALFD